MFFIPLLKVGETKASKKQQTRIDIYSNKGREDVLLLVARSKKLKGQILETEKKCQIKTMSSSKIRQK
jgi:hypothetical protein